MIDSIPFLVDNQYNSLTSFPPFNLSMTAKGTVPGMQNYMSFMPNGMCQFQAPIIPTAPPPSNLNVTNIPHPGLQVAAQAAMEKRFRNVKTNGPSQQQMTQPPLPVSTQNNSRPAQQVPVSSQSPLGNQAQTTNTERPDSVASSLTSTIPPTPTNLLSPNLNIPMQPLPFNPMNATTVPGPMPIIQNAYPFMATPFSGFVPPSMPEIPADSIKDALCKQM